LIVPSSYVCRIIKCVDKKARQALCTWATISNDTVAKIQYEMKNNTFESIRDHNKENHVLYFHLRDDHITIVLKDIVREYLLLFYHKFGRVYTERS